MDCEVIQYLEVIVAYIVACYDHCVQMAALNQIPVADRITRYV